MSSFDSDETLMDKSEVGSQESGRVCLLSNKDHEHLNTVEERKLHSLAENTNRQKKILELTPSKQTGMRRRFSFPSYFLGSKFFARYFAFSNFPKSRIYSQLNVH